MFRFATKRDAAAALLDFLRATATGHGVLPTKVTVADYLSEWLNAVDLTWRSWSWPQATTGSSCAAMGYPTSGRSSDVAAPGPPDRHRPHVACPRRPRGPSVFSHDRADGAPDFV